VFVCVCVCVCVCARACVCAYMSPNEVGEGSWGRWGKILEMRMASFVCELGSLPAASAF
jgi:hypothetical protein